MKKNKFQIFKKQVFLIWMKVELGDKWVYFYLIVKHWTWQNALKNSEEKSKVQKAGMAVTW